MKYLFLTLFFPISHFAYSQTNLLLKHKELLLEISKYIMVDQIDDFILRVQIDPMNRRPNFGFGVAHRDSGILIYPEEENISYRMMRYKKYITIVKETKSSGLKYGLIDFNGNVVLDFIYDRIGDVFVPLPDSIITVQNFDKFGFFNLDTKELSDIKYDNSGQWLNDGYSYHEGGAYEAQKNIYKQLGLENYNPEYIFSEDPNYEVTVSTKDGKEFLINEKKEIVSKKYYVLRRIWGVSRQDLYFVATYYNEPLERQRYKLLNKEGEEIAEMTKYQPDCNEYYITLSDETYFFIDTKKVVTVPDDLYLFVDCYAKEGILGFKSKKNGDKFFIDKYGNSITENDLK